LGNPYSQEKVFMPIFLLIRHGENDYVKQGRLAGRLLGVHLNEKGRLQAQALAGKLTGAPVKAIYSSPLVRALETAEPIGKALNLEVIPREGLIELDVGEWQEQKLKGLRRLKLWRAVQTTPSQAGFPGGETFAVAQLRICQELQVLATQHDPKDLVVCVSHSDPIKLAVSYFIGQPLDMFQRLAVSPGSITALMLGEGAGYLLSLNTDISFTLPKA
jgi:probable phosphomutase (TIGR03848 family)